MRYSSLALAFAFVAIGFAFAANAKKQEPDAASKSRLSSVLFFTAAGAFLFAFAISFVGSGE